MSGSQNSNGLVNLGGIAESFGFRLEGDAEFVVTGIAPLNAAGPADISFAIDSKMAAMALQSAAGALILPEGCATDRPSLITGNPLYAVAKISELLRPEPRPEPGIDETAAIGDGVKVGEGVYAGPQTVIGRGSSIGARTVIMAGARIGEDCVIGENCLIHYNAAIYHGTVIGNRVRIHANTTIGSDGFGYTKTESGEYYKIPQNGTVTIEDDVEIGSNSSVDRATFGVTLIKKGVKLDNQIQIAHNVTIGENTVIAGCSGVAGSTSIGKNVMIGGMVAVSDHVRVGDGIMIAGKTGVHTNLDKPGVYAGPLAMKNTEYKRFLLSGKRLDKLNAKIKELEKRLKEKEE